MNSSRKGARNEHRSKALLEAAGYRCTRAAGSHGVFDLVCLGPEDALLVQVKSGRWPGTTEMAALYGFAVPPCAKKVIHRWNRRARVPDVRRLR